MPCHGAGHGLRQDSGRKTPEFLRDIVVQQVVVRLGLVTCRSGLVTIYLEPFGFSMLEERQRATATGCSGLLLLIEGDKACKKV